MHREQPVNTEPKTETVQKPVRPVSKLTMTIAPNQTAKLTKKARKNMKKKNILLLAVMCVLMINCLTGCSFEDEADVASHNLSKEADNFNIYRKIKVMNCQSDEVLLEFEGWCSINKDNTDNQLEITYRVGEGKYYKDFIGLNDRVTYLVTQVDGATVDKYHYEWTYHSKGDLIPIELKDEDTAEPPVTHDENNDTSNE